MHSSDTTTTKDSELCAVLPRIVAKGVPQKGMTETIYKLIMYVFSLIDVRKDDLYRKRIDVDIQKLNKYMGREVYTSTDFLRRAKEEERGIVFSDKKTNVKIFSEVGDSEGDYYVVLHDSLLNHIQVNKDKEDMFFEVDIKPVLQMKTKRNYYTLMMYVYLSIYLDKQNNKKLIKSCLCEADTIKAALGVERYNTHLLKRNVLSRITEAFNKEPYSELFVTYEINGSRVELFVAKKKFFSDYDEFFDVVFSRSYKEKPEEKVAYILEQSKINEIEKYDSFMYGLFTGIFVGGIIGGAISVFL